MKNYKITYTDCGETFTHLYRGYDANHAAERFIDSFIEEQGDCLGIEIISVVKHKTIKQKIAAFHKGK
jgi:hypothetical protein